VHPFKPPWLIAVGFLVFFSTAFAESWPQWGRDSQHWGFTPLAGQSPSRILADTVYDPFSPQEQAESGGSLLTHYPHLFVIGSR
jgi:hypothetical protein